MHRRVSVRSRVVILGQLLHSAFGEREGELGGAAGCGKVHFVEGGGEDRGVLIVVALHLDEAYAEADDVGEGGCVLGRASQSSERDIDSAAEVDAPGGLAYRLQHLRLVGQCLIRKIEVAERVTGDN